MVSYNSLILRVPKLIEPEWNAQLFITNARFYNSLNP